MENGMKSPSIDISNSTIPPVRMFFWLLVISQLFYLFLYLPVFAPIQRYVVTAIADSILYIALCRIIWRHSDAFPERTVRMLILAGIVMRLSVLFIGPIASDDIYRYIWDGKVQSFGIDPYRYAPSDPALSRLHTAMIPGLVNFPEMKTLYPPLAEWFFRITYMAFGESIIGFKVPLLCAEIVCLLLLRLLMRRLNLPASWIALYAFCPLPIMQFMIDGHLDALGLPFLLAFILLWTAAKPFVSLGWLGISAAIKLVPLIFVPFAFHALRGWKKILSFGIPLVILALAYLPSILERSSPFEALETFSSRWAFNGSVFHLIYPLFQDNARVHIACTLLFFAWAAFLYFRNPEFIDGCILMLFGFFIFAPTVHPWYLTWLAVLLPLRFRWSAIAFVALVSLSTIVIIDYKLIGIWKESPVVLWLEYGLLAVVLLWEYIAGKNIARSAPNNS